MLEEKPEKIILKVKEKVMEAIKSKRIKMRSPFILMAEKLGLESALVAAIIAGALFVSVIFYFLKKNSLLEFLSLGIPGVKFFLAALPYDYVALFIVALILAIYLANKIELFCGHSPRTNTFGFYFFVGAVILGIFFGVMGVGRFFHGWSKKDIPADAAIHGRVENFTKNEVVIVTDEGKTVKVFTRGVSSREKEIDYEQGKFLWAIGQRDKNNPDIFHAEKIKCCEAE